MLWLGTVLLVPLFCCLAPRSPVALAIGLVAVLIWYAVVVGHAFVHARRRGRIGVRWSNRSSTLIVLAIAWALLVSAAGDRIRERLPFKAYRVPSSGMEPTLRVGDCLVADRRQLARQSVQSGDDLVFEPPGKSRIVVKRCSALAGDTVQVRAQQLHVNGVLQREPSSSTSVIESIPKATVRATGSGHTPYRQVMRS